MKRIAAFDTLSEWLGLIATIAHDNVGVTTGTVATICREFLVVSPIARKHSGSVHF